MGSLVADLRSDAYALPTDAIRAAMRDAEGEWVAHGSTRHVRELEAVAAEILGKEASIFVPTGTMANLIALMTQGKRGTSVVVEAQSHMATLEDQASAYVTGLQMRSVKSSIGVLDPSSVAAAIDQSTFFDQPGVTVVGLENSHNSLGGTAMTVDETAAIAETAHRCGAKVHLDGARVFNAALALGVTARELAEPVDTVSFSLNKGLRAPVGAMLGGTADVIRDARWCLRQLGAGTIHQTWLFAAAGLVALERIDLLAEDNARAGDLADRLAAGGLTVRPARHRTNIVLIEAGESAIPATVFAAALAERGVLVKPRSQTTVRLVTHGMLSDGDIERAADVIVAAARVNGWASGAQPTSR